VDRFTQGKRTCAAFPCGLASGLNLQRPPAWCLGSWTGAPPCIPRRRIARTMGQAYSCCAITWSAPRAATRICRMPWPKLSQFVGFGDSPLPPHQQLYLAAQARRHVTPGRGHVKSRPAQTPPVWLFFRHAGPCIVLREAAMSAAATTQGVILRARAKPCAVV
jgi:hypothetical protein